MSLEDILKFKVLFYSNDGVNSPIINFLNELLVDNKENAIKCLEHLENLPLLIFNRAKEIKSFSHPKLNFFELKVKGKNKTEYRFFFIMENPSVVVVYAFDKKTQKTEKRDINKGVGNLEMYLVNKKTITPF